VAATSWQEAVAAAVGDEGEGVGDAQYGTENEVAMASLEAVRALGELGDADVGVEVAEVGVEVVELGAETDGDGVGEPREGTMAAQLRVDLMSERGRTGALASTSERTPPVASWIACSHSSSSF